MLAGGSGTRFGAGVGEVSKVMVPVAGRPMISWSVEAAHVACDGVSVVVPAGLVDEPIAGTDDVDVVAAGGATRSASVRAGLATIPGDVDVVVCHDAARPGATASLFSAVIAAVRAGADAAVPVLPVRDTLKRVRVAAGSQPGAVTETVDRTDLFAVQTPQAFRRDVLIAAHADGAEATDDAALVEAVGGTVATVPGEHSAHKVTTRQDLAIVEALMAIDVPCVAGEAVTAPRASDA